MSTTMDTINNFATAAAKAVWGENGSGQEPISGKQGDVSKGEPYDAGNIEEVEDVADPGAKQAKTTGTATETKDTPQNASAEQKTKAAAEGDTTKEQNDVRDPADPQTHPKNAPTDVDNTEEGVNKPQKLDGPGPKPLEQVAKEHGGDAGVSGDSVDRAAGGESTGAGDEEEDEVHQKSTGEGTGEQYVKSTGLKADGGDFDVTKPGAGREADRLLEEKGIHKTDDKDKKEATITSDKTSPSPSGKEKKSLKDKIKEKLHKS